MINRHYFNNIEYTKWPFFISIWVFFFIYFFILFINKYLFVTIYILLFILCIFSINIFYWFFDITIESSYLGRYNRKIRSSILFGFFLFLASEVMLFAGFFWAYFDRVFHLNVSNFCLSYFYGIEIIHWYNIPMYATFVLLTSGYLLNISYYYLRFGDILTFEIYSYITILLSYYFLMLQLEEYKELTFTISDGVYCSLFFLLTGFHGMHVLVGSIFLTISFDNIISSTMWLKTNIRHIGFSLALIYWHFVDVIWIFLFIFIYVINNKSLLVLSTSDYIYYSF